METTMQREDIRQYARVRYRDGRPSGTWVVQSVNDGPIVVSNNEGNRRSAWPDELVPEVGVGESLPVEAVDPEPEPASPECSHLSVDERAAACLRAACHLFGHEFPSAKCGESMQPVATLAAAMLNASYAAEQVAVSRQILECQLRIERGEADRG